MHSTVMSPLLSQVLQGFCWVLSATLGRLFSPLRVLNHSCFFHWGKGGEAIWESRWHAVYSIHALCHFPSKWILIRTIQYIFWQVRLMSNVNNFVGPAITFPKHPKAYWMVCLWLSWICFMCVFLTMGFHPHSNSTWVYCSKCQISKPVECFSE